MPSSVGAAAAPTAARYRGRDTKVDDADLTAFQAIHAAVQEAWGHGDLGRMRQLMTPEMLSYFSEELTRNTSEGVQNLVSNVRLLKGDISEAWEEGDLEYATAYMQWRANDYVVRLGRSPGAPGLPRQRRADAADRGRGGLDLCPPPRRQLAAVGDPAGVTGRSAGNGGGPRLKESPRATARGAILRDNGGESRH